MIFSGYLSVASETVGAIKRTLNQSGWLEEDVLAAGQLRQGTAPSTLGMITGTALVEVVRPRRSKSLPRHFVLAVTQDRIVAFKAFAGGGTGEDDGPYMLRIKPGECGSWPRSAMRLVDLPDGPQSKQATLELNGSERLPVSRPNLNGDPDTDDLFDLLSGGVQSTRQISAREQRVHDDNEDLRRARSVSAGDDGELAADAARGRPQVELTDWAQRRKLSFRGGTPQGGHLSVTCPWSTDLLFNVVRGHWPGGTYGVLCHEVRLYRLDEAGAFRGGQIADSGGGIGGFLRDAVVPLMIGGISYQKVPYTSAGARVPHLGSLTGLHVARRAERHTKADHSGMWRERPLDGFGLPDNWIAAIRKNSDDQAVERLLHGPIRDVLAAQQGLGFEIRIEYGQVIVSTQDFLARDQDLDALVELAECLAGAVRELGRLADARSLNAQLSPPEWLASARSQPGKRTSWPIGARLDKVVQIADQRGLEIEDPLAFHRAFPALSIPGQAFCVLRGRLPGTALNGRLVCCAERPMTLPDDFRKILTDPGGRVGCDVVVVGVDPTVPATPPEGEVDQDLRVAVAEGVLTAWRTRQSWQADGPSLDQLASDVEAMISRRRITTAGEL
jgi:hypothetical protein